MYAIVTVTLLLVSTVAVSAQGNNPEPDAGMWRQCIGGDQSYGCPVIVLPNGQRLFVVPPSKIEDLESEEYYSALPDGNHLIIVPPAGHLPPAWQAEDPWGSGIMRFLTPRGWDRRSEEYDSSYGSLLSPSAPGFGK